VELRGHLTRFASEGTNPLGAPPRHGESSSPIPSWFNPLTEKKIRADRFGQPFSFFLVELRGIEPLTPRLPARKGRKTQSLNCRLVSRFER